VGIGCIKKKKKKVKKTIVNTTFSIVAFRISEFLEVK
jgi:hypothetical protein